MSAGTASLVFLAGALVALALEIMVPLRGAEGGDSVERGSTNIMPEDR